MPVIHHVGQLNSPNAAYKLISKAKEWPDGAQIKLDMRSTTNVYPNGVTSLASVVRYLSTTRAMQFEYKNLNRQVRIVHLLNPIAVSDLHVDEFPTNRAFKYSTEGEASEITQRFIDSLTEQVACESGVIDTLDWCIHETLDNVFQHSMAETGFVMMQVHIETRTCAISIADTGRGIQKAMFDSPADGSVDILKIGTAGAAISHAIEKGVTSKGRYNQGNGLYGLQSSVKLNGGQLSINSGRGTWIYKDGDVSQDTDFRRPLLDADTAQSTFVDWRLNCNRPVQIDQALGLPSSNNRFIESIEAEEGYHLINSDDIRPWIGFRRTGDQFRTKIVNYLQAGAAQIVIDFSNIYIISSSFADEAFGKLALELGADQYRSRIFVRNANPTIEYLIQRAINLRTAQE